MQDKSKHRSLNFLTRWISEDGYPLLCLLVFAFVVMSAIPLFGIPDGRDLSQHLQFAITYYDAIRAGDFFPGWGANENLGFGSVGIRFYPPLTYYLLALTRMVTGNWFDATWINFFFWMFIGSTGVYYWSKEWLSSNYALLAAMIYVAAPYHLSQIYQLMLVAEFAAAGILPFCFLFATRVCRRGRISDVLLLGTSFALLILTHIPTTIIGSIGLLFYSLAMIERSRLGSTLLKLSVSVSLAALATSFHWIKIVTEMLWLNHNGPQYTSGFYDYHAYLFPMIIGAGETYSQRLLALFDITIVLTIILIIPVFISIFAVRRGDSDDGNYLKIFRSLAITGTVSLFLLSKLSTPLWESFSILQKLQFPWRWLSVATLVGSLAFAISISFLLKRFGNQNKVILYAALCILILVGLFDLTQNVMLSAPISRAKFEAKVAGWKNEGGCQCWWPKSASHKALAQKQRVEATGRDVNIQDWNKETRGFEVGDGNPADAHIATFFYPYWEARIDAQNVPIRMGENGEIVIPISRGSHKVVLEFREPPIVDLALVVSIVTWLLLAAAFAFYLFRISISFIIQDLKNGKNCRNQ